MVRRRQARPMGAVRPRRRLAPLIGWLAAGAVLVVLAVIVGRPAPESAVDAGRSSPTPVPPIAIAFGTALDPSTNEAVNQTSRFRSGDPFAYPLTLDAAPGVDTILVQVVRLEASGEVEVQPPSAQKILPDPLTFAFQVPTDRLLAAWGPGDYEMRISMATGESVAAVGRFILVDTP